MKKYYYAFSNYLRLLDDRVLTAWIDRASLFIYG